MYWLDTAILALVGVGAVLGAWTGILKQAVRVVGFSASLAATIFFHGWAANWLQQAFFQGADPAIPNVLSYAVVFVTIMLAFQVTALAVEACLKAVKLKWLDRLCGAGVGSIKAALILGVVFLTVISYPHPSTQEVMRQSRLAPVLAGGMELSLRAVPAQYTNDLRAGMEKLKEAADQKAKEIAGQATTPNPETDASRFLTLPQNDSGR